MNKIIVLVFVLLSLSFTGCGSDSNDLGAGDVLEGFAQEENSFDETNQEVDDNKQMKLVEDCDFLTALDVKTICGTDVTMTKLDDMYGPCAVSFKNDEEHTLRLIYYQYPPTDNKDRMYDYCIGNGGEEFEEFVCATPNDKNVYVFGDYYSISLGEEYDYPNDKVCQFEDIKELGKFLKEKIYS